MAQRRNRSFKVPFHHPAPSANPFAGTDVQIRVMAEKDDLVIRLSRQHAEELRAQLDRALVTLDQINQTPTAAPPEKPTETCWRRGSPPPLPCGSCADCQGRPT